MLYKSDNLQSVQIIQIVKYLKLVKFFETKNLNGIIFQSENM